MLARVFRGYAPDAVDELVRSITEASEHARSDIRGLEERARRLGAELDVLEQPDRELRETFVTAQREAARIRAETARRADAIRADARGRTQERLAWLEAESARLTSELERMRGVEDELHGSMRAVLSDALRRLGEPAGAPAEADVEEPSRNGTVPAAEVAVVTEARVEDETTEPAVAPPSGPAPAGPRPADRVVEERPSASRSILYSIAIIVAAAGIGVAIWQLRAEAPEPARTATAESATATVTAPETEAAGANVQSTEQAEAAEPVATTSPEPPATTAEEPVTPPPARAALLVRAAGGDCWLSVRVGSASGRLLFEGFLFDGESRRFDAKRIWMRVGNGGNLAARLNGKPLRGLPAGTGDVLVTADGAQTLALG